MVMINGKRLLTLSILAALAFGLGAIGCSDGEQGPAGPAGPAGTAGNTASIYGWVQSGNVMGGRKVMAPGDEIGAIVHVGNIGGMPSVTMNGQAMGIEPELIIYGGGIGFMGNGFTDANNSVQISASFVKGDGSTGVAGATVQMADSFAITATSPSLHTDTVFMEYMDDLTVNWSASANANEYWIEGYLEYRYIDTSGSSRYRQWDFRRVINTTTITLTADSLFGDTADVDYMTDIWGRFNVFGVTGPSLSGAANGNITGDGQGVLLSVTEGGSLRMYELAVGSTSPEPGLHDPEAPPFIELFREMVAKR